MSAPVQCALRRAACAGFRRRVHRAVFSAVVLLLWISADAAAQVRLAWNPNPEPDVVGYRVYVGAASRSYHASFDVGNRTSYTLSGLPEDRPHYFAVTAYTSSGAESEFSDEITTAARVALVPEDTSLNINARNYSAHTALMTYTWPDRQVANAAVLKFDLSSLPPGALIQNATLRLWTIESDGAAERVYSVTAHRIVGRDPAIARATGYSADGVIPWTPNTSCHDNVPLAQADILAAGDTTAIGAAPGAATWTITRMVQQWVSDPATNFGVLLNGDASAAADRYRFFASTEHPETDLRPTLLVDYFVPPALDRTPPAVRIVVPSPGDAYLTGTVSLDADASDDAGGVSVRFMVDGVAMGAELTSAPYTIQWDTTGVSDGTHSLVAVARDAAGNSAASEAVVVLVANGVARLVPRDTSLNLNATNYSAHTLLTTYTWPDRRVANAVVLKFNLSGLPAGAVVHDATLRLALVESDAAAESTYFVSAHRIIGRNPAIGKATGYTADGISRWTASECCHNNVPLAQADISPAYDTRGIDQTPGEKTWTLTRMVQEWLADPETNFGVLLNSDASAQADRYRFFASMEHGDVTLRPILQITYSVPQ